MGTTIYKTLFEVKFIHHYFLNKGTALFDGLPEKEKRDVLRRYNVNQFLSIEPTESCKLAIARHRCIFKTTPTGFLGGVQALKTGTDHFPFFSLDNDLHFSFKVCFTDPFFTNYTALPFKKELAALKTFVNPAQTVFFAHNSTTDSNKKFPFLTRIAPKFKAGQKYSAGDILADSEVDPTKLFMAKKVTGTAPPSADWFEDDLVSNKPLQYAGSGDLLPVFNDSIRFSCNQVAAGITVTVKDRWGNTIMPPFDSWLEKKKDAAGDQTVLLVAIHQLPEDLFTIKFEDTAIPFEKTFSFFRLQSNEPVDMLIDLAVKSNAAAFSMIDNNSVLKEREYQVRFKNRFTMWQYKGDLFNDQSVTGPHPLTKSGYINAEVKDKNNNDVDDLPNPAVSMIRAEHPANDPVNYNTISEIFIS